MNHKFLLMADTNNISDYIYASNVLKEIRGASTLLNRLNEEEVPRIIEDKGGECLSSAGGEVRALFDDRDSAENAMRRMHRLYREQTGIVQITTVIVEQKEGEDLGLWMKRAEYVLRDAELYGKLRPSAPAQSFPPAKKCTSCRKNPVVIDVMDKEPKELCPGCRAKHEEDAELRKFIDKHEDPAGNLSGIRKLYNEVKKTNKFELSNEMNHLGGTGADPMLAMVYCDGNGIGNVFRNLLPREMEGKPFKEFKNTYSGISKKINEINFNSVAGAYRKAAENSPGYPIAFLMVGGDDLVAVMPARNVFHFTIHYANDFSEEATSFMRQILNKSIEKITVSAGVAVVKPKYPIYSLYRLAYKLMDNAKRMAYKSENRDSFIDYWITRDSFVPDFEKARNEWKSANAYKLYQRPYSIKEFKSIVHGNTKLSRFFFHHSFPNSRTKDFYELLEMPKEISEFQWQFTLSQLNRKENNKLPASKAHLEEWYESPWIKSDEGYSTPVLDILDLKPFLGPVRGEDIEREK